MRALALLPNPPTGWEAATWIYAALGDTYFQQKQMPSALTALDEAMRFQNGIGNPFLHLRRGQVLCEIGRKREAAGDLARAYMSEGEKIFKEEDPKYLDYLKSVLRPPAGRN